MYTRAYDSSNKMSTHHSWLSKNYTVWISHVYNLHDMFSETLSKLYVHHYLLTKIFVLPVTSVYIYYLYVITGHEYRDIYTFVFSTKYCYINLLYLQLQGILGRKYKLASLILYDFSFSLFFFSFGYNPVYIWLWCIVLCAFIFMCVFVCDMLLF